MRNKNDTTNKFSVSKSQHSEVIEKLNEKRKKAHKDVIDEICVKTKEINVEIEEEIFNKSNKIKCRLKQIRDDTDYSLYLVQHTKEHVDGTSRYQHINI